jgi:hypothetical protein
MIGNFEFALGPMVGVWLVVEAAVSERTAQALVEEQEQKSDLDTFAGLGGMRSLSRHVRAGHVL